MGWKPEGNIKQPTLWEDLVQGKRDDDLAKIRSEWLLELSFIEKASLLPSIAGEFIESLLDPETLSITSMDVPDLLALTTSGSISSEVVVTAFCKRAAFAHQLVWFTCIRQLAMRYLRCSSDDLDRINLSWRLTLRAPLCRPKS